MKYALGNMLNGAGGLNADGLSLDLQFAADKTLTARKGPTPTFIRASTATFVGSNGLIQSAAINAARFDHDPLTLACKGLLIEEQRVNICTNSNLLTSASWNPTAVTVVASDAAPDGANAYEVTETTTNTTHALPNSGGTTSTPQTTLTTGVTYTQSIFLKKVAGSIDWAQLTFTGLAFPTTQYANFNLSTGTIGNSSGVTARIEQFPNGWYRCSITATATSSTTGGNTVILQFTNNTDTNVRGLSYPGSTSNKVLAAIGQFEAGSFPTSYIPTTTGPVTRSADVCSITGSAFSGFYNQLEGTILAGYLFRTNSAGRPFYIGDGTSSTNTMEAFNGGSGVTSNVFSGGAQQYTRDVVATNNSMVKTALAVAVSNAMLAVNGTLATSGGGLMPVGVNQLIIGNRPDGARNINGHISVVRYFRKRLPNAKLQTLTT